MQYNMTSLNTENVEQSSGLHQVGSLLKTWVAVQDLGEGGCTSVETRVTWSAPGMAGQGTATVQYAEGQVMFPK